MLEGVAADGKTLRGTEKQDPDEPLLLSPVAHRLGAITSL